ncbi:MAG TPA: hypothetical protein VFH15_03915 [Pyrinomonadaceae bacterium]|nr:hypothetical protein [Pyrinomonadaceae bacterium]
MANLTDSELDEIIKQSLPGYKVSSKSKVARQTTETDSVRRGASASQTDASRAATLRRRYLGTDADATDADEDEASEESATLAADEADSSTDDEDDEMIVAVEPETVTDPLDRGSRAKAAVISKKEKKVIGQQG